MDTENSSYSWTQEIRVKYLNSYESVWLVWGLRYFDVLLAREFEPFWIDMAEY